MHIGNNVVHVSHNILMFKQLLFCNICGCRGSNFLKKLAKKCEPPTTAGFRALKELRSGKLPSAGAFQWPVDRLDPRLASDAALPSLPQSTHDEAKHVPITLSRCADFSAVTAPPVSSRSRVSVQSSVFVPATALAVPLSACLLLCLCRYRMCSRAKQQIHVTRQSQQYM